MSVTRRFASTGAIIILATSGLAACTSPNSAEGGGDAKTIALLLPNNNTDDSTPLHVLVEQELLPLRGADEATQYEAVTDLCAALAQRYAIAHVAGHEHVAPGRKQDPGAGFEWARLRASLAWDTSVFP